MKRHLQTICAMSLLGSLPYGALAQETTTSVSRPASLGWDHLLHQGLGTVIFGLLGIGLAILGFKLFDLATPWDLEQEICEKRNMAAAVLGAAVVLGVCAIVAVTVV